MTPNCCHRLSALYGPSSSRRLLTAALINIPIISNSSQGKQDLALANATPTFRQTAILNGAPEPVSDPSQTEALTSPSSGLLSGSLIMTPSSYDTHAGALKSGAVAAQTSADVHSAGSAQKFESNGGVPSTPHDLETVDERSSCGTANVSHQRPTDFEDSEQEAGLASLRESLDRVSLFLSPSICALVRMCALFPFDCKRVCARACVLACVRSVFFW